jgi:hypothetical protein
MFDSTIYVTLWASANISYLLGKTENAEELWAKHVGGHIVWTRGIRCSNALR